MRRDAFDPTPELARIRAESGVHTVVNPFGMTVSLITRHDDADRDEAPPAEPLTRPHGGDEHRRNRDAGVDAPRVGVPQPGITL